MERRMAEDGVDREPVFADVKPDTGIAFAGVPVGVVVGNLALFGDLVGFRLQLLEADDVGPVAIEPLAKLRRSGTNAVHVPRRDLHRGVSPTGSSRGASRWMRHHAVTYARPHTTNSGV